MIKIIYPLVLIIYFFIGVAYFSKFEISYKIVKIRPELVEVRSLTQDEVKALDQAYTIRIIISNIFIVISLSVALFSFYLLRNNLYAPKMFAKIVFWISLSSGILLLLASGVNFIPGPPIQ